MAINWETRFQFKRLEDKKILKEGNVSIIYRTTGEQRRSREIETCLFPTCHFKSISNREEWTSNNNEPDDVDFKIDSAQSQRHIKF